MKKIYSLMLIVLGLLAFSACDSDRDSNPTLNEPDTFTLNLPPYAENNVYDLANSATIELTCSQPDYGVPMGTTYAIQMCLSEDFVETNEEDEVETNYVSLSTVYTNTKMEVDAVELALALVDLWDLTGEGDFPTEAIPLYFRSRAHISSSPSRGICYSNIIELPKVLGYKAEAPISLPETMYMIGSFEGTDNWGKWLEMVPVTEMPGKFWKIQYFSDGDLMKFNMANAWEGNQVGYSDGLVPEASKTLAAVEGADDGNGGLNIQIGKGGWYTVVVTTKLAGVSLAYTLEFFETNVYLTSEPLTGAWGAENAAYKFVEPTSATEPFVSPAATSSADLRIFAKIPDVDWWRSEFVVFNKVIEYRENRGELGKIGIATDISVGQKVKANFITGEGSVE